jgi:hypothetical protein
VRREGCGGTPIRIDRAHSAEEQLAFLCEHPIEPGPITLNRSRRGLTDFA